MNENDLATARADEGLELSDEELDYVVGGLSRVFVRPELDVAVQAAAPEGAGKRVQLAGVSLHVEAAMSGAGSY